jgi:hypothetical protein
VFSKEKLDQLTGIFEEQWEKVGRKMNSELDTPHFRDERLLQFLLSDEVLDLVEPLIGPNIALWSSHFICKEPLIGKKTPCMKTALSGLTITKLFIEWKFRNLRIFSAGDTQPQKTE